MLSVRLRKWAAATWIIALACQQSTPAGAEPLIGELQSLVQNHPQILAKTKTLAGAGQSIREARAAYFPTVKTTGDAGPEYVDSPSRRNTEGHAYYKGRETSGLTVTQKLFDGFATNSAVEAATISEAVSNADLRVTRQNAILEGALAYIDVMRQSKLIGLARENERKLKEQQNLEDERVQKGAGIAADVLAAKQRLATAKNRRLEFEQAFHAAVAKYEQVFGHAPSIGALSDPPLAADLLPATLEDALKIAGEENPTVELAARTEQLAGERRRGAEAGYYPTLDLIGKANYENDKNATVGVRRDWSLLLTANWELFSGFKTDAQVTKATFDHAASMDSLRYAGRKVQESIRTTWHKLASTRQRLEVLENAATLAEEVWEGKKKSRDAGKATIQEVLDEETRINDARIDYNRAYYDMLQASYELLTFLGRLEVENLVAAPGKVPQVPMPEILPAVPMPEPVRGIGDEPPPPIPMPAQPVQREGRAPQLPPVPEEKPLAAVEKPPTPVAAATTPSRPVLPGMSEHLSAPPQPEAIVSIPAPPEPEIALPQPEPPPPTEASAPSTETVVSAPARPEPEIAPPQPEPPPPAEASAPSTETVVSAPARPEPEIAPPHPDPPPPTEASAPSTETVVSAPARPEPEIAPPQPDPPPPTEASAPRPETVVSAPARPESEIALPQPEPAPPAETIAPRPETVVSAPARPEPEIALPQPEPAPPTEASAPVRLSPQPLPGVMIADGPPAALPSLPVPRPAVAPITAAPPMPLPNLPVPSVTKEEAVPLVKKSVTPAPIQRVPAAAPVVLARGGVKPFQAAPAPAPAPGSPEAMHQRITELMRRSQLP